VSAHGPGAAHRYTIVGQVALAQMQVSDEQRLDAGATFTLGGFLPLTNPRGHDSTRYIVGNYAPHADRAAVDRRIDALRKMRVPPAEAIYVEETKVTPPAPPPQIDRLHSLSWFPPALSSLLGILALAAVAHAVVTAARRRRRELALLKTLGFERMQVRTTVAWQATTLGFVGVVVGIPLGALIGAVLWRRISAGLGIADVAVVPSFPLLVILVAVLLIVNAVAFVPARRTANAWPARVLTAE
jgi:hypothetical protein